MVNCRYCKRELKNPESIARGCGMTCAKKNNVLEIKTYKYINLLR